MGQVRNEFAPGFGKMMRGNTNEPKGMIDGKRPPMSRFDGYMPFLNSFKINDNLNIYYISTAFRENSLMGISMIIGRLLRLLVLVFWLLIAIWVYNDSKVKGLNQMLWGILGLFTGVLGLIIYLIYTHKFQYCSQCKNRIEKNANYCTVCGNAIYSKCSSCGNSNQVSANYCINCGAKQE
jgi:hypothetical protein